METLFNEDEWIKTLFLLSDTQEWINEVSKATIYQIPTGDKRKLFRKTYYITITGLAHLLERHYYKISRHPQTGKFTIPIPEILCFLRDAYNEQQCQISGSLSFKRIIEVGKTIGFDKYGNHTNKITIVTDSAGQIKTAFPGC